MKETKRMVRSIMVLCLILLGLLISEKAYTKSSSDFVIKNGVLTKYQGSGGDLVIPDGITEIGSLAFFNCNSLTSIIISDGVTRIGDSAFSDCSSLTSITIPNSVTAIGSYAFSRTPWLDKKRKGRADHLVIINNILVDGVKAPKKVTIPDKVTVIGDHAFSYYGRLTSVTIPNSVIVIGDNAFTDCSSLASITLPDSVTKIGEYSFSGCRRLKEFTIPKNVTKLGSSILSWCDSLEKITILNKKVDLIKTFPSERNKNKDALSILIGNTEFDDGSPLTVTKPTKTLTLYGYKYSTADEFAVRMNTLQVTGKGFGIKSLEFVPLNKNNTTLDAIKIPKSITITKGKAKKLSIQLPPSLKRVNKFTKKQGQVKISITYSNESLKTRDSYLFLSYDTKKISNDTIKATKKGTCYAYTTVTLPNGDKKVFATKVIVK